MIEKQQVSLEKLNTQVETLHTDKKRLEEDHSRQMTEKEQQIASAVASRHEKQRGLEDAHTENNRLSKAYRHLCQSTDSKIAAGAAKDTKISDLGRQLQSAKAALKKKEAGNAELDADMEKKIVELSQRLEDTISALEEKTAEVESVKEEADAKVSTLESEIQTCRSQLEAKGVEKDLSDTTSKRRMAGLKFLLMASKAVITRQTAEKNACKAELGECWAALDKKTAEVDALRVDQASETSTQVSETRLSRSDNVSDAQTDEKI